MRSLLLTAFLATTLLPALGCNLYFSGGDDDPPCDEWGGGSTDGLEAPVEPYLLRNPETGVCEDFGWGGPGGPFPCDDACGPCVGSSEPGTETPPVPDGEGHDGEGEDESDALEEQDPIPPPTWGYCDSYCTGLDEGTCLATDGCRGIYNQGANGAPGEFLECWATDQYPQAVDCEGLDAYSCSTSDACVAVHEYSCNDSGVPSDGLQRPECVPGLFISCHNEVRDDGCYSDEDCEEGASCNASEVCLSDGTGDAVCYGYCVPEDCPTIAVVCPDGFAKTCPPNGCEADCICEPIDPGECDGEVLCDALPPRCEFGSTPGIANGCWTGQCIFMNQCPLLECQDIASESLCIARGDCSAYYVGGDCSCDANGCDCNEWDYDSCGLDTP